MNLRCINDKKNLRPEHFVPSWNEELRTPFFDQKAAKLTIHTTPNERSNHS